MSNEAHLFRTHNWGVKWTEEEDIRLLQGIERFGDNDWRRVSEVVGTRDAVKCQQRWDKVLRPDLLKGKWTEEEDDHLKTVVIEGYDHWGKVAEKMPGRTAKQCRERWSNYLDPNLLKTPFTLAEDEKLLLLQRLNGNKWALISRELPGRTENGVKLRFNSLKKLYGDNLSSINLSNAVVVDPHQINSTVGYNHQQQHQSYDSNKDNRRKASEEDLNDADKKQRVVGSAPVLNYAYSQPLESMNNNEASQYIQNAPLMQTFPAYGMNINMNMNMGTNGGYDGNAASHLNGIDTNVFYAQMQMHHNAYMDKPFNLPLNPQSSENNVLGSSSQPSVSVEQEHDTRKYASVREFTEGQSSDEEEEEEEVEGEGEAEQGGDNDHVDNVNQE